MFIALAFVTMATCDVA